MWIEKAKNWADFILKVVSIIGIVLGGYWAVYQFRITGTSDNNIEIGVSTDVVNYSKDLRLLVIHVKPKNIGKVPVYSGKEGIVVTVRKITENQSAGDLNLDKLTVICKNNLLAKYHDNDYLLEPGVQYNEIKTLLVPAGIYSISAEMDLGDEYEIDDTAIVRVE